MPQHNITRIEAEARAAIVTVKSYEVVLVLDGLGETFRSVTTVRFDAEAGAATFVDAILDRARTITLNGRALDPAEVVADGRIALSDLAAENVLVVDGDFLYMNTGEGLHRFVDPVDEEIYLYTQFEVADSRRVFAVFEQPDLKASFAFTIVAPEHWTVVSNSPTPAPKDAAEVLTALGTTAPGTKVWQFAPTPPVSSYITALIAGPYSKVSGSLHSSDGEDVELGVFCRKSLFEYLDADNVLEITRQGFAFYESLFDTPYPFEKYDQLFVPEFNAGAMENAGAVTFLENYVFRSRPTEAMVERRAVTILHELAHMWFGDLVTMKWWNDLWLNESFAEFMSTLATAEATDFTEAWTTFATLEKSWAYRQDQLPSTHPIVAEIADLVDVEVNFDGITYAKGASVLKQLVAWVGRENFFVGVKSYFDKHAWSNTRLSDLLVELEAASGRDLSTWSKAWLEESGVNVMRPEVEYAQDGTIASLHIVQEAFELPGRPVPSLRPHRLGVGFYDLREDGTFERRELVELDIDSARAEVPGARGLHADVIVVNDADLSYTKARFDERSLATVLPHAAGFTDSLTQLVVLSTLWDMVRDGEVAPVDYIDTLTSALPRVTQSSGLLVQLRQLNTALGAYVAPAERAAVRTRLADSLWDLYVGAEAGSDQQFQFFQGFVRHACSDAHLHTLSALLAGTRDAAEAGTEVLEPREGLEIDTDLRWQIVTTLAEAGILDESDIAEWLALDDTAEGRRHAQTALSVRRTPDAKTEAFLKLVGDTSLPNATVGAIATGFARGLETAEGTLVEASAPLSDFVTEYFERVESWWTERTLELAQTLTLNLYPPASDEVVSRTEEWFASHPDASRALLRLMRENLDGAQRSLRVRR